MAQTEISIDPKHEDEYKTKLYNALMRGREEEVINLCKEIEAGPLHIITIHNDTILHMATYCNHKGLVLKLLELLQAKQNSSKSLTFRNKIGNTVFHDAATSDRLVPAAKEMLRICPGLLDMHNSCGETALFRAARYGMINMYEFLDGEVQKKFQSNDRALNCRVRDDKTNILHISILAKHFDLAVKIVKNHEYLAGEKDGNGMTGLQLLACNSSSFLSGSKKSSLVKLFYKSVLDADSAAQGEVETCCRVPLWEAIQKKRRRYKSALELAKFLIEKDTSWANTEYASKEDPGSPLILATKSGCTEIVREILDKYPHAVEHVDAEGHNILQLAIKYRQIEIFDLVEKMVVPMKRLIQKIDDNGHSLLQMVGEKAHDAKDMRSPVLHLQEVLLLFERVKNISTSHFNKANNSEEDTPKKLLEKSISPLHSEAKEWTKRTAENCSIVAVLFATVAFAAAYTVPGGPDDKTGFPILLDQPFFITFTMADVLSLAFALSSVITFLSILTSPFQLKDFEHYLPQRLLLGVKLLILSVSMMMLAFAATIILMIQTNKHSIKIALYAVAFLPVAIFAFSYSPLYAALIKTYIYSSLKIIGLAFPRCNRDDNNQSCLANVFNFKRFQATNASNNPR